MLIIRIINIITKSLDCLKKIFIKNLYSMRKIRDIKHPEQLLEYINSQLSPKTFEKQKYGEVFTPMTLVNEMLDKLPKKVWKDKDLKWLDPAAGIGNFPIAIYNRLMHGLKNAIPTEEKRRKHILEEMLYMVELNTKNIKILKTILCSKEYKLNIFSCSFIEGQEYKKFFKPDFQFDIIVGNPPYNDSKSDDEEKQSGSHSLWNKFVIKSIESLKNKGFLSFVHPSGWRKPDGDTSRYHGLYDLMSNQNQLIYLEIHDTNDGMKTFNCGTRYDWYLLEKRKQYKDTIIKDELGEIDNFDLSKIPFLPNSRIKKTMKLITKKEKCEVLYNRSNYGSDQNHVSENKSSVFKYPLIHSTPQTGIRYMYSSKKDLGHFGVSKVIFGETGIYNAITDVNGKYGMTNGAIGIVDKKENLISIKKAIESDKFKEILESCSWSNYRIEWRLFNYFNKDFYKEFI
jgi:hypothetical protein